MRRLAIILSLITLYSTAFCQVNEKETMNPKKMIMIEFSVYNITSVERAVYMNKIISPINGVYFCGINHMNEKGIMLCEEGFDMLLVEEKLNDLNYVLGDANFIEYDEAKFFDAYINIKNEGSSKTIKDQPFLIKTGNPVKDKANYYRAKEIWKKNNS